MLLVSVEAVFSFSNSRSKTKGEYGTNQLQTKIVIISCPTRSRFENANLNKCHANCYGGQDYAVFGDEIRQFVKTATGVVAHTAHG